MSKRTPNHLAQKLVKHFRSKKLAAEALNIHRETFRLWLRDGIPLAKALDVERNSGGAVKAEEVLRDARQAA